MSPPESKPLHFPLDLRTIARRDPAGADVPRLLPRSQSRAKRPNAQRLEILDLRWITLLITLSTLNPGFDVQSVIMIPLFKLKCIFR